METLPLWHATVLSRASEVGSATNHPGLRKKLKKRETDRTFDPFLLRQMNLARHNIFAYSECFHVAYCIESDGLNRGRPGESW